MDNVMSTEPTQHEPYPLEFELSRIADKVGGEAYLIRQVHLANVKAKKIHHSSLTKEEKIAIILYTMESVPKHNSVRSCSKTFMPCLMCLRYIMC